MDRVRCRLGTDTTTAVSGPCSLSGFLSMALVLRPWFSKVKARTFVVVPAIQFAMVYRIGVSILYVLATIQYGFESAHFPTKLSPLMVP